MKTAFNKFSSWLNTSSEGSFAVMLLVLTAIAFVLILFVMPVAYDLTTLPDHILFVFACGSALFAWIFWSYCMGVLYIEYVEKHHTSRVLMIHMAVGVAFVALCIVLLVMSPSIYAGLGVALCFVFVAAGFHTGATPNRRETVNFIGLETNAAILGMVVVLMIYAGAFLHENPVTIITIPQVLIKSALASGAFVGLCIAALFYAEAEYVLFTRIQPLVLRFCTLIGLSVVLAMGAWATGSILSLVALLAAPVVFYAVGRTMHTAEG